MSARRWLSTAARAAAVARQLPPRSAAMSCSRCNDVIPPDGCPVRMASRYSTPPETRVSEPVWDSGGLSRGRSDLGVRARTQLRRQAARHQLGAGPVGVDRRVLRYRGVVF